MAWHLHAAMSRERWLWTRTQIETHLFKGLELYCAQSAAQRDESHVNGKGKGERELVLIGASAGWMMSTRWLEEFTSIDAYDIDPLSPLLFKLNHAKALAKKGIEIRFHLLDAIDQLSRVLSKHPNALIWFDNVLGQHHIRLKDSALASTQLKILQRRLKGRFWGSVHDLYSGPVQRANDSKSGENVRGKLPMTLKVIRLDNSDQNSARVKVNGVETSLGQARQQFLQTLGATPAGQAWLDHETSKVFPTGTPLTWAGWDFKPNYCHCLEMGWTLD